MPQSSTSTRSKSAAQSLSEQEALVEKRTEGFYQLSREQPAIVHPNFDPKQTPVDPARPLNDIPEPAQLVNGQLRRLYDKSGSNKITAKPLSKWQLVASKPFAEHLALLSAAKLIALPDSFYHSHSTVDKSSNVATQTLLATLEDMTLIDMADIQHAMRYFPKLTRFGIAASSNSTNSRSIKKSQKIAHKLSKRPFKRGGSKNCDHSNDLLNSLYADDWQVILQPQDFEMGVGSLATDILACSVAVHALKQCSTRKTINQSYNAEQICHYLRSYLLSQLSQPDQSATKSCHYRQIRLFAGHVIVAAHYLGCDIQVDADNQAYFNLSSRCGLLTHYANMQDYYINGWGKS